MVKLFAHYVSAQAEEKALDLVLVLRGTKKVNLWSINILSISAKQVSL